MATLVLPGAVMSGSSPTSANTPATQTVPPVAQNTPTALWVAKHEHSFGTWALVGTNVLFFAAGAAASYGLPVWGTFLIGALGFGLSCWGTRRTLSHSQSARDIAEKLSSSQREVEGLRESVGALQQDLYGIVSALLGFIAAQRGLTDRDRLTLYRHTNSAFQAIGRHCENPTVSNQRRAVYPASEGCIGMAWRDGSKFIQNLPDPNKSAKDYLKAHKRDCQIEPNVVKRIRMRSRSYSAFALKDYNDGARVAVLVAESLDPARFGQPQTVEEFLGEQYKTLSFFLHVVCKYEPRLSDAMKEGF